MEWRPPRIYEEPANGEVTPCGRFYYDKPAADRVVEFFPRFLKHQKGPKAGQPFVLAPFQEYEAVRPLFGWKRVSDGSRRYRRFWYEIPRKNAKSTLGAGLTLYLTLADGEYAAEVYGLASDIKQAGIIFNLAKWMRSQSPALSERSLVFKHSMTVPARSAVYQVLSRQADAAHGLNPSAFAFDEVHTQKNWLLYEAMTTGMGARFQPLEMYFTTAGEDEHSLWGVLHAEMEEILEDPEADPYTLVVIYKANEEDDWLDEQVWARANPLLGDGLSWDYFREQAKRAKKARKRQASFKRLHLNMLGQTHSPWIDMDVWDAQGGVVNEADLVGRDAFLGLDLSTKKDLTCAIWCFPPLLVQDPWTYLCRFFLPEKRLAWRVEQQDRAGYSMWADEGYLTVTPGRVVDYDRVYQSIDEDSRRFNLRAVAYDPWNASHLIKLLLADDIECVAVRQGMASMAGPTKEFDALWTDHRVRHGGNPVLRWNAKNVQVKSDDRENFVPIKVSQNKRIDGIVGAILGTGIGLVLPDDDDTWTADEVGTMQHAGI